MKTRIVVSIFLLLVCLFSGCKETAATVTQTAYKVEYTFALLDNDSVGNEWETSLTFNGEPVKNGGIIHVASNAEIVLRGEVIEMDKISDVGSTLVYFEHGSHASTTTTITVTENRGAYSGCTATWQLFCSITRI